MSKARVQQILKTGLRLRDPRFKLRRYGSLVSGSVISETFSGKGDFRRQEMIRSAFDKAIGGDSFRAVGTLLAYTPAEWDVDLEATPTARRAKAS